MKCNSRAREEKVKNHLVEISIIKERFDSLLTRKHSRVDWDALGVHFPLRFVMELETLSRHIDWLFYVTQATLSSEDVDRISLETFATRNHKSLIIKIIWNGNQVKRAWMGIYRCFGLEAFSPIQASAVEWGTENRINWTSICFNLSSLTRPNQQSTSIDDSNWVFTSPFRVISPKCGGNAKVRICFFIFHFSFQFRAEQQLFIQIANYEAFLKLSGNHHELDIAAFFFRVETLRWIVIALRESSVLVGNMNCYQN